MAKIIYGSEVAREIKSGLKSEIEELKAAGKRIPMLAVVLVGNDAASLSYVAGKEKACQEIGIKSRMIHMPESVSQKEVLDVIDALNQDNEVDGILVQLPLPKGLDQNEILLRIDPDKDVDGLHPVNAGRLMQRQEGFVPCTPQGVMELLIRSDIELEGKHAVVVGRSALVGNPVAQLLLQANATVTVCHSRTQQIEKIAREADILIVAIGKPRMVKRSWIKPGACVIDVRVNRVDGRLCGDVDFEDVLDQVSAITPVPKGVGPMTITMLLKNTCAAYRKKEGVRK